MKDNFASSFVNKIKSYFDLKLEYYRLGFVEKFAMFLGLLVLFFFFSTLAIVLLILLVLLLYQVLLVWISIDWLVTLIEFAFILISMILIFCFKEKLIIRPVATIFIRVMLKERENIRDDNLDTEDAKTNNKEE